MLRDLGAATALRYVVLRYFNVAGCDPGGRIGQSTINGTLLTKVACETAVGKRPHVSIFGTDYPTPDGTGVRDYIHVEDLAERAPQGARLPAQGGESATLNCGYGHGYSVREVISMVDRLQRPVRSRRSKGRAAPAIRRRSSPRPTASARSWAGRRSMTTWMRSCARSWSGSAGCSGAAAAEELIDQPESASGGAPGLRRAAQAASPC